MKKGEMIYEGKAKKIYRTDDPQYFVMEYKDDATAFNGEKKGSIRDKGVVNNHMANLLLRYLEQHGIPTHFMEELSQRETLVKAVEILPLEVIIRNVAAGSFSKRYGVPEGQPLAKTTLEFSYKKDELGDPLINEDHIFALQLATPEQLEKVREYAFRINELLSAFFDEIGLTLIDFKLEFGWFQGEILLADEISPDTCRLWDKKTGEKMDKDRFRRDLGNVEEAYQEVLKRIVEKG